MILSHSTHQRYFMAALSCDDHRFALVTSLQKIRIRKWLTQSNAKVLSKIVTLYIKTMLCSPLISTCIYVCLHTFPKCLIATLLWLHVTYTHKCNFQITHFPIPCHYSHSKGFPASLSTLKFSHAACSYCTRQYVIIQKTTESFSQPWSTEIGQQTVK